MLFSGANDEQEGTDMQGLQEGKDVHGAVKADSVHVVQTEGEEE